MARRGRRALAGGLPVAVLDEGYDRLLSLAGQLIPWNFASLTAVGHRSSRQTLRCSESVKVWTGLARGVWALRYSHYSTLSGTVAEASGFGSHSTLLSTDVWH